MDVVSPSASFTILNGVLNTNEARVGTNIVTTSIKEGTFNVDKVSPFTSSFAGTGFANITNPTNFEADGDLFSDTTAVSTNFTSGDFNLTASIVDNRGFNQASSASFTVTQSPSGSLNQQGSTFFLLESVATNDPVVTTSAGTASSDDSNIVRLLATYTNSDEGSPSAQNTGWFTASSGHDSRINISPDGYLSASSALIPSNKSGDDGTVNCRVHFTDQYNNIGTGSFQVTFVTDNPPSMSLVDQNVFNTNQARNNAELVRISFNETVDFTTLTLTNDSTNPLNIGIGDNGTIARVTASSDPLVAGVYGFTASIEDTSGTGRTSPASHSFTIVQAPSGTLDSVTGYIFEHASSGDSVVTQTHGRTSGLHTPLAIVTGKL